MEFLAAVAGGLKIFEGLLGIKSGREADKAARAQGEEEARIEREVTAEKIRKLGKEETALRGQTIAAAAGAGVKTTMGSPLAVLAEQAAEFARERLIVEKVGASRADVAIARGTSIGKQAKYAGYQQASHAFSNLFSILGDG